MSAKKTAKPTAKPKAIKSTAALGVDPKNPRRITDQAAAGLSVSLSEFGDLSGIVFNERTQQLVCGHQRIDQIRKRWGELPIEGDVIRSPEGHEFRVRLVDWPIAKQRAANVAANSQRIAGEFTDGLDVILSEIKSDTPELYDSLLFAELQHAVATPAIAEDDVPEPPKKPITKPGDLWLLGEHRLLCGDSTKSDQVERLFKKERAGLMNTDPPYGINFDNASLGPSRKDYAKIENDDLCDAKLQAFLESVFRVTTAHALNQNAAWYLWHAHLTQGYFAAAAAAANVVLHRQIIWVKNRLILGRGHYHWKHEPCFMGWVKGSQPPDYGAGNGERTQTTVWEIAGLGTKDRAEFDHASPKPVQLFAIPIVKHLKPGEICFEPFSGSGPQFIAAQQLGRRCFGIEIEPKYCDVIVKRWETLTGEKAKRG